MHESKGPAPRGATTLVWDLPLRLFHWLLAIAIAGAWFTYEVGGGNFRWHSWFGYATVVLVVFRLIWGFVGPRHARFANFVRGIGAISRYARALFGPGAQRTPGHNPLGALMVVAMLALTGIIALTGLFANDEIFNTGPLYGYVSDELSDVLSRIHRELCDVLWIAIAIHLLAIGWYWAIKRDNLVVPMITGRKRRSHCPAEHGIAGSRPWLALLILAAVAAALYVLIRTAPEPSVFLF